MRELLLLLTFITLSANAQVASRLLPSQSFPLQTSTPENFLSVNNTPGNQNRVWAYSLDAIRIKPIQITWLSDSIVSRTSTLYKSITWLPSMNDVQGLNTALSGKQPVGNYLTSFTELDPTVPLYAKSLTGFGVIKNSTDALYQPIGNYLTSFTELDPTVPAFAKGLTGVSSLRALTDALYKPISYVPTSTEITTSLGYTPYNGTTNPNGYITLSQVPSALVSSVNTKTGAVIINAADVGLGNVNNTSDANKPLSTATTNALNGKMNTVTYYNASGTISQPTKVWKARVAVTSSAMTIDLSSAGFTSVTNLIAHVDIERLGITPANAITRKIRSLSATTLIVDLYQPLAIVLGGLGMTALTDFTSTWLHITVEGN